MTGLSYDSEVQQWLDYDREHLWHPYTSMQKPLDVYPVKSAKGATITLDIQENEKSTLIEAMSSWWCMIHGYNNPEINEGLINQINSFSHVMFGGLTHKPAVTLVRKLIDLINHEKLQFCFLADSGSVAVEVALKMALQYQLTRNNNKTTRSKFLSINNGYHGDTLGAMSVCDPINSMHSIYKGYLPENIFASAPTVIETTPTSAIFKNHPEYFHNICAWDENDIEDFKLKMQTHRDEICAVILEPILQGAGGMRIYHPQFLIEVRKLCNKFQIPLIMDEIATGFGRTGAMFAFHHCKAFQEISEIPRKEQVDVYPDIICVGKALTGGYMTLSAVVTTAEIKDVISKPESITGGCFMHGPTFMGNPLACSAANISLDILSRGDWHNQVSQIEEQLFQELYLPLKNDKTLMNTIIENVRIIGAVGVVELKKPITPSWFHDQFVKRGVYIRPFNRLVYIMPPYIIHKKELTKVTSVLIEVLREWKLYLATAEQDRTSQST
ncbi:LAFE_0B00386g1_1 [Lachancea fermentati]|uniref:LAFE_0B00386g1_1 n=1 Tax=Lachancea fermentati TaxID=4955 RepID=A0A1G4M7L5_LACFM|nr:LAFE_0B00386g1_1 [Lachancea fermentati]